MIHVPGTGFRIQADVDNFCQYAPGTPNCPMTNPGGYCDRNMSGTYDDADWLAGWYDYQATCGS